MPNDPSSAPPTQSPRRPAFSAGEVRTMLDAVRGDRPAEVTLPTAMVLDDDELTINDVFRWRDAMPDDSVIRRLCAALLASWRREGEARQEIERLRPAGAEAQRPKAA